MAYYNEKLAVWEPLVEMIEDDDKPGSFHPWTLNVKV